MELGPKLGPSGGPFSLVEARKLRRVNECVDGYEPGGRRFESCRARHIKNLQPPILAQRTVVNNSFARVLRMLHPLARVARPRPIFERSVVASALEHLVRN